MTKEEAMAINMKIPAKTINKMMLAMLDSLTSEEKMKRISSALNSSTPESVHKIMDQLANKDAIIKLFSDTTQLKELLPVLNGCCFTVN